MSETLARTEVRWDEGVPIIALIGEFDLASKEELRRRFRSLQRANCRRVVLDLSQTQFLDSTTLGALVRAHREGLDIAVRGASGIAQRALEVSGLASVFNVE